MIIFNGQTTKRMGNTDKTLVFVENILKIQVAPSIVKITNDHLFRIQVFYVILNIFK